MKFGKSLSNQIEETLPEWRDKFLSYKELKKRLKLVEPNKGGDRPNKRPRFDEPAVARDDNKASVGMSREEIDFISLLEDEMEKFNTFFVEKEEEYIIRLKELQDSVANAKNSNEEIMKIRKEIVDFHGEMVLLENYSALNYTGLVKILKKYDKRTGALIRLPFIQRVLQQPFYTTDLLYKLVKQCEKMLDGLFPTNEKPTSTEAAEAEEGCEPTTSTTTKEKENDGDVLKMPKELAEIEYMESLYMKSTISALRALKEIRSGSSTRLFACFGRGTSSGTNEVHAQEKNVTADVSAEEQRRGGAILVELFSSQGCATSPEAEMLISRLGRGDFELEVPVIVLAYHVDYWDYMGWKDPFGSSQWTVRQKAYVEALNLDTMFTPQVVIQGGAQCQGNDQDGLLSAITNASRFPGPTFQATFQRPTSETLQVSLTGALRSKVDHQGVNIMVALYESGLVTDCPAGENKGRVLANDYVVRKLEKLCTVKDISAKKNVSGTVTFPLWDSFNSSKCGVAVFAQNSSHHIFGSQNFQLPENI